MIMILSGTKDGRDIVKCFSEKGYPLIVTTATSYGGSLIEKKDTCTIIPNKLNRQQMETLIVERKVKILIDATHPYAVEVSENAMKACENTNINYMRYQREESKLEGYEKLYQYFSTYEETVKYLTEINGNILLTTGSKTLEIFVNNLEKSRLFPRVLPVSDVIKKCEALGIKPSNIIAMQGPFSVEMNMEIIKKYNINVLVSKESGNIGGTVQKLEAASRMKVPVLLIGRPKIDYKNIFRNISYLIDKVSEIYG